MPALVLDPASTPIRAELAPALGRATDLGKVTAIDLERLPDGFRLQRLVFQAASPRRAGFWIHRTTWGGTLARIIRIKEFTKYAPYFGNPSVLMDVYGLEGGLKQAWHR